MPKPTNRSYIPYALDACQLLGSLIREARLDRRMSAEELAQRSATSRSLVQRVEAGDPGCSIGAVFNMAAVLKVQLFGMDSRALARHLDVVQGKLKLLPKHAYRTVEDVDDDF